MKQKKPTILTNSQLSYHKALYSIAGIVPILIIHDFLKSIID